MEGDNGGAIHLDINYTGTRVMNMLLTIKTANAAALFAFAAMGSMLAVVPVANAQPVVLMAAAAQSKPGVKLTSTASIERVETDSQGATKTVLKSPSQVAIVPGDKVVFTLDYLNEGQDPASGFRATNPMPGAIQFVSVSEDWAEVSVDGGASWGKLSALTLIDNSASNAAEAATLPAPRAATAADVTHVRWVFADAIAPGKKGTLSYVGVVK
jgi:uncharacterized repeat protein (TIGR01451 family)